MEGSPLPQRHCRENSDFQQNQCSWIETALQGLGADLKTEEAVRVQEGRSYALEQQAASKDFFSQVRSEEFTEGV